MNRIRLAVALALGWAASASADDWGEVAQISTTLGVQANRLCLGEGSRGDIGCPTYAPYVSATSGYVGIGTTNPSASLHVYSGSTSAIRLGASTAFYDYVSPKAFWIGGASGAMRLVIDQTNGKVGIGAGFSPSTSLHLGGTLRMANGGEACDADRAGAVRWHEGSGQFQVCYGSGGWALLSSAATSGSTVDRIVSGTSSVIASQDRSVTISTAGSSRMTIGETGNVGIKTSAPSYTLHVVGNFAMNATNGQSNGLQTASNGNFQFHRNGIGNNQIPLMIDDDTGYVAVGMDGATPSATLDISGTVKVAGTGAESCTMDTLGQIRLNPTSGKFEVCRH